MTTNVAGHCFALHLVLWIGPSVPSMCDISNTADQKCAFGFAAQSQLDHRLRWGTVTIPAHSCSRQTGKKRKGREDSGPGHLLSLHCLPRASPSPTARVLARLLTPRIQQMKTHCSFSGLCLNRCCPCSCCAVSSRLLSLLTSLIPRVGFSAQLLLETVLNRCRCDSKIKHQQIINRTQQAGSS